MRKIQAFPSPRPQGRRKEKASVIRSRLGCRIFDWTRNRNAGIILGVMSFRTDLPVLERRKPTLLLRLSGLLLLRLAARTFCGLLFHDPPRNTRLEPSRRNTLILIALGAMAAQGDKTASPNSCSYYIGRSSHQSNH